MTSELRSLDGAELRSLAQDRSAAVLCLDFPKKHDFGFDARQWTTGPEFCGLKLVPPGLHFMHYDAGHGMRQGSWHELAAGAVLVRRWDAALEEFAPGAGMSGADASRYAQGVHRFEFDRGLGAFDPDDGRRWLGLAGFVDIAVLNRCGLSLGTTVVPGDATSAESMGPRPEGQLVPHHEGAARAARFSAAPLLRGHVACGSAPVGAAVDFCGAARTAYVLDGSARLRKALRDVFGGSETQLLGELQLAFVLFLTVSAYDALEQWKALVALMCSCAEDRRQHPSFHCEFLRVLLRQLELTPEDLFTAEISADNFLRGAFRDLFELLEDEDVDSELGALVEQVRELKAFAERHYGRDAIAACVEEDGLEDGPVVVSLEEAGLAMSLAEAPPITPSFEAPTAVRERMSWMLEPTSASK